MVIRPQLYACFFKVLGKYAFVKKVFSDAFRALRVHQYIKKCLAKKQTAFDFEHTYYKNVNVFITSNSSPHMV